MLIFLLVVLVEFIKNMSVYNTKASARRGESKENFLLRRFLKQNYEQHLLHNRVDDEGLKLICGMTDFSQQQNHINNPELHSTPQNLSSNKRPLLAANLNSLKNIRNNCNNNNNNNNNNYTPKSQSTTGAAKNELSVETIRNNVQIVLNNIQRNAIKQKQQQQLLRSANGGGGMMTSPESDFNSNLYSLGAATTTTAATMLGCSIASSHDFTHDNSDYQWFLDYGYRDGITHQSVLSSLSASYNGIGELSYYEDLAKNIDVNLAEVDMESFRTEDIHSLLANTTTKANASKCKRQLDLMMDNSICKSELLFSPVRESHISVDSLDMDGYPNDEDIILTCQANKDNYTIAFEGSVMYSDESYYDGPEFTQKYKQQQSMNLAHLENIVRKKAMDVSMARSDNGLTTWSKLRKNSSQQQLPSRCPSRNNNVQANLLKRHLPHCFVHKSSSMPNLKATQSNPPLNVSQAISNSSVDSYGKLRSLLPMYQMPISTSDNDEGAAAVNQHNQSVEHGASDNNNEQQQQQKLTQEQQQQQQLQPSFNLVKLFIKQKSSSTDTCMDVSSGCWPSDSTNSSTGDNNNSNSSNNNNNLTSNMTNNQRLRKKSMNDSGKGSALSRHDEEELRRLHEAELRKTSDEDYPYDSLDPQINQAQPAAGLKETNDFNREVFDSPSRRQKKNYREFNIIRNQIKNPIVFNLMNNNNTSISNNSYKDTTSDTTASRTSENLTQIFNSNSSKAAATAKIPIEMLTKSMQTSTSQFVHTANAVAAANANTKEQFRIVPPSFLAQLNKLGDDQRAPVFVVYPNYALPDLGFLKQQPQQPADVILSPLSFKEPFAPKKRPTTAKRPFSMNATDNFYLNQREYKHVKDWQSLMTLLPREYRKLLKNIPECQEEAANMMDASMSSQRPMFCMTPPIRRSCGVGANRTVSCDCVSILTQTNNYSGSSSGESSSQPPSSGYRGSSTLLTDSDVDGANYGLGSNNSLKNMYVYQYEAGGGDEGHPMRPPSGRHQRGILRRTNTNIRLPPKSGAGKRNSMFEDAAQHGITVAEKRRSLQDPYYMTDTYNIVEDFIAETNAEQVECDQPPVTTGGLPNYPKQRDSDRFTSMKQQLRDFDLNKAVTNKLNADREEMAARMRAENFLTNVPKSELKHYAEVANLLESIIDESKDGLAAFDCGKLRNVVSRALSSQKRVSFDREDGVAKNGTNKCLLRPNELHFTTPPNSPNMSTIHTQVVAGAHKKLQPIKPKPLNEKEKMDKVACNRFKRLQIQWELLSKESAALAHEMQGNGECGQYQAVRDTKSGGNTPVGHSSAPKSRIPRPVSYPTSKGTPEHTTPVKTLRSPSRMVPPKKYSAPTPTPAPRTPNKVVQHTTPKRTAPVPRVVSRTR